MCIRCIHIQTGLVPRQYQVTVHWLMLFATHKYIKVLLIIFPKTHFSAARSLSLPLVTTPMLQSTQRARPSLNKSSAMLATWKDKGKSRAAPTLQRMGQSLRASNFLYKMFFKRMPIIALVTSIYISMQVLSFLFVPWKNEIYKQRKSWHKQLQWHISDAKVRPQHSIIQVPLTGCVKVPSTLWLLEWLSIKILTSLCNSRDSVKNFATSANGSGTSFPPSRLTMGH